MDFPGQWAAECERTAVAKSPPVTPHFEAVGITYKPKKAARLPQEPHSPSESPRYFAAITLQCADESIIVGYYTSAEVHPPKATRISTALVGRERSSMARGDGIHRTSARNMRLTTPKLKNAQ